MNHAVWEKSSSSPAWGTPALYEGTKNLDTPFGIWGLWRGLNTLFGLEWNAAVLSLDLDNQGPLPGPCALESPPLALLSSIPHCGIRVLTESLQGPPSTPWPPLSYLDPQNLVGTWTSQCLPPGPLQASLPFVTQDWGQEWWRGWDGTGVFHTHAWEEKSGIGWGPYLYSCAHKYRLGLESRNIFFIQKYLKKKIFRTLMFLFHKCLKPKNLSS